MKFLGAGNFLRKKLKKYFTIKLIRNCFIVKQSFRFVLKTGSC
jgi:hypothetical protein